MNTLSDVVIYGASGHGAVVADVLRSIGGTVAGFVDDDPTTLGTDCNGSPVLGDGRWLLERGRTLRVALGIGDNKARRRIAERLIAVGIDLVTAVHAKATVADSSSLGHGTVVMAGAVVNPRVQIGTGVIINTGAVVEHDNVLGDWVHVSPNATLGGNVYVGAGSHVALAAVILPGRRVGAGTTVGAGAVVTRDLADGVVAFGAPARVHRNA